VSKNADTHTHPPTRIHIIHTYIHTYIHTSGSRFRFRAKLALKEWQVLERQNGRRLSRRGIYSNKREVEGYKAYLGNKEITSRSGVNFVDE